MSVIWTCFGALVIGSLVTELTPVVLGTGKAAKLDWSFFYVTMRFILLPGLSLGILAMSLVEAGACVRAGAGRRAVRIGAPALVSALYLTMSLVDPLPWLRGLLD